MGGGGGGGVFEDAGRVRLGRFGRGMKMVSRILILFPFICVMDCGVIRNLDAIEEMLSLG